MNQRISRAPVLCTLSLLISFASACSSGGHSGGAPDGGAAGSGARAGGAVVALQLGPDLPPAIAARVDALVRRAARRPVTTLAPADPASSLPPGSLAIGIGETALTRRLIAPADVDALGSEAFVVRSRTEGAVTVIAADGNPPIPDRFGLGVNRGLAYGAYALLEELGFAFLHPLAPTVPAGLDLARHPVRIEQAPHWPVRAWHLHTMHPLELTDVCNGWGPGGPADEAGWRAMLPEWELFCEWLIANRQNRVEWVLLMADSWQAFADGPERIRRIAEVVDICHRFGLAAGCDAPLALKQQHSYALIRRTGDLADELDQLRARIDHLMSAGYDFFSTEMGFSEFTHPDPQKMLAWMDEATRHLADAHGAPISVKTHVSAGQEATGFPDPVDPSKAINFNFLVHYADSRMGAQPHTVQHYGLDDPAPTYGRRDFDFMYEFLRNEAGRREVLWHPETAYWVSFDVDVPLFLPVYAERRLADLRRIMRDERAGLMGRGAHAGSRIQGQSNFSSGWEWGYWIGDVVCARAVWDPFPNEPDDAAALRRALDPIVRTFGPAADAVRDRLVALCADERALLIEGRVGGRLPRSIARRSGQAYLQGFDTWDDMAWFASLVPFLPIGPLMTQPARLTFLEMNLLPITDPVYPTEIEPLLAEMAATFGAHAGGLESLRGQIPAHARPLFDDMADAARMTALRARQVHGLYDYVHRKKSDPAAALPRLVDARAALDEAARIVPAREAAYRCDPDRIAGWRENPTSYQLTYLWTVRSLHYWWRDEGLAVDAAGPTYLNVIDPFDVAFGEGVWTPLAQLGRALGPVLGAQRVTDALAAPAQEPVYPPAGLRSRP